MLKYTARIIRILVVVTKSYPLGNRQELRCRAMPCWCTLPASIQHGSW